MIQLAAAQYIRDNRQNEAWNNVCKELLLCIKIKRVWKCEYKYIKIKHEPYVANTYEDGRLISEKQCTYIAAAQIRLVRGKKQLAKHVYIGSTLAVALNNVPSILMHPW